MLFFTVQQGYGFLTLPTELTEEELIELYKLEQIFKAEQTRDKLFVKPSLLNPYFNIPPNIIIFYEDIKEKKLFEQKNENFQLIIDKEISIAEKKLKKIQRI